MSATPLVLLPEGTFTLGKVGSSTQSTSKTFLITQTGTLQISATGTAPPQSPGPPLPLVKIASGNTGPSGGQIPGELIVLKTELLDPNGKVFPSSSGGTYVIGLSTLAEYRDAAGYSTGRWTVRVTNTSTTDPATNASVGAVLEPFPEPNVSAGPMLDNPFLTLQPGATITQQFEIDRLGSLVVTATPNQQASLGLVLLSPGGRTLATGNNRFTLPVGLRDLHLLRQEGRFCALKITAPAGLANLQCNLLAQITETIHLDDSVLQQRLDAIIGTQATGNYIVLDIEWDSTKQTNVVYLTISEPAFTTLDNFGIIDTFSDNDFARQQARAASNPSAPAPKYVYMDPGVRYPAYEFVDSPHQFSNFTTSLITAIVGYEGAVAGLPHLGPSISFNLIFQPSVNGNQPQIHDGTAETVQVENPVVALTLYLSVQSGALTVGVQNPQFGFGSNLEDLPDWAPELKGDPNVAKQIQNAFNDGIAKIPASASAQLQSIFTILMGGLFTFESVDWGNNGSDFVYIPAAEPAPLTQNPSYLPRGAQALPTPQPVWTSPNAEKIDHIVVLMMENRSFDHVMGYLSLTGGRSDIDGLSQSIIDSFPDGAKPAVVPNNTFPFDPSHAFDSVKIQMGSDLSGKGPMRGFGLAFLQDYPFLAFSADSPERIAQDDPYWYPLRKNFGLDAIMSFHNQTTLPYYASLIPQYMVCNRWYSSHPGPTFPNRFFYLSGHLADDQYGEPMQDNEISNLRLLRERTIQDALTERAVSWKVYESPPDVAMLRMYARYAFDDTNIVPISEFYTEANAGQLPSVSFLEPNFHVGTATNDDHPPCDMHNGQVLIQNVVEALQSNPAAWAKTLLLICYDEHGGIYDHVYPDIADSVQAAGQPAIETRYGVRIPAMIVSPWVPAGGSTNVIFDHTSILKTIMNRFSPNDPAIMSDRMVWANDFFQLLTRDVIVQEPNQNTLDPAGTITPPKVAPGSALKPIEVAPMTKVETEAPVAQGGTVIGPVITKPITSNVLTLDPILRGKDLFGPQADFHQYMGKLSSMLRPTPVTPAKGTPPFRTATAAETATLKKL